MPGPRKFPARPVTLADLIGRARWNPPAHLVAPIERYVRMVGKIEGSDVFQTSYVLNRAITELIEIGLSSVPEDAFALARAESAFKQVHDIAKEKFEEVLREYTREMSVVRVDFHEKLGDPTLSAAPQRAQRRKPSTPPPPTRSEIAAAAAALKEAENTADLLKQQESEPTRVFTPHDPSLPRGPEVN